MKSIKILACLLLATVATGCATVELSTNGGNGGWHDANDVMQQMAKDSEAGGE